MAASTNDQKTIPDAIKAGAWLVRDGKLEEAEAVLTPLVSDPETGLHARRLLAVCAQLRRWGLLDEVEPFGESVEGQPIDFSDETKVLIHRHERSKRVLLVFTGNDNQMWISINLFHQVLRRLPWNIVYLRNPAKRVGYGYGLRQFGSGFRETVLGMKQLIRTLGGGKVFCIGNSSGAYASVRYGLELNASGVLALAPTTLNPRDEAPAEKRGNSAADIIAAGSFFTDIRKAYQRHDKVPSVTLVYGAQHESDSAAANHAGQLPGVSLEPIDGFAGHDVVAELIIRNELMDTIKALSELRPIST